jgi:transposase-like protein
MGNTKKVEPEFKREAVRQQCNRATQSPRLRRTTWACTACCSAGSGVGLSGPASGRKRLSSPQRPSRTGKSRRLKRELARVQMERDIIKKALGYFASPSWWLHHGTARCGRSGVMCRVMTVSASGYYDWAARTPASAARPTHD